MTYTPLTWEDEVPVTIPIKYSIVGDVEGELSASAEIVIVTPVTAGTPVNATNLNHLENGVTEAQKRSVNIQILDDDTNVDSTEGIAYFFVPAIMDGFVLQRATAMVMTAGTTNPTTIQVRNLTKHASNDALSTAISIASGETIATAGVVNASYDAVSTNDKIKIYVTAQSTTKPKGLWVVLEYGVE